MWCLYVYMFVYVCVHVYIWVYMSMHTSFCVEDTDWCVSQLLSPLFLETRPHWTWSVPTQLCRLASECQGSLSDPCRAPLCLAYDVALGAWTRSYACTAFPLLMESSHQTLPVLCFETGSSYRAHYEGRTGLELAVISNPLASLGWQACCTIIRRACGFLIDVLIEGIFSQKYFE